MLLLAAAAACSLTAAASAQETVEARVYGVGADYPVSAEDGFHTFQCACEPTDGSAQFWAACSREQARDLGGDEAVTLELGPCPVVDLSPAAAATEARLRIVHPRRQITGATGGGRRRARRDVPDGPRSVLVVLVNYADMAVTYATEASARLMVQNPDGMDVDGLLQASSYGRISFPANLTTVITVDSPLNGAQYAGCDPVLMAAEADRLVAEQHPGIDTGNYIHTSYLIPDDEQLDCRWTGMASMNSCHDGTASTHCKTWLRTGSAPNLAHQLGHNLGARHAADDMNDDGIQESEYGDAGAIMGMASQFLSLNAPYRERLGYLGDGNGVATYDMACAAQPSVGVTQTISRLDLPPGGNNPNPNMVRIARYNDGSSAVLQPPDYLLSFKAPADWDGTSVPTEYGNRLQIHTYNSEATNTLNTMIVGKLGLGEEFTGRANRDGSPTPLTIRVVAVSADAITVTVNTACQAHPTQAPTQGPTSPTTFSSPTFSPLVAFRQPTDSPATPKPSATPPSAPPSVPPTYCPEGYSNYGTRYGWGLGKITIVTAHEQCSARCTRFSGPQFAGGCKTYMSGMFYGMLFCRSYGGNLRSQNCAAWAIPANPGVRSGQIGVVHTSTNQLNVGGNCCSNATFVNADQARLAK